MAGSQHGAAKVEPSPLAAAARLLLLHGLTWCDCRRFRGPWRCRGGSHSVSWCQGNGTLVLTHNIPVFDLLGHCQESLFDIGSILSWSLQEGDRQLVREFLSPVFVRWGARNKKSQFGQPWLHCIPQLSCSSNLTCYLQATCWRLPMHIGQFLAAIAWHSWRCLLAQIMPVSWPFLIMWP